jgi:DNA polymerase
MDDEIDAIEIIAEKGAAAYDEIKARWGYVGKVLSRLIRPAFIAPEGQTLVFTDLSSIEAVVCPWLTDDEDAEPLLEAIRANHADPANPDMYRVQAGKMLGKDPFEITKGERQSHGKTIQLACIAEGQLVLTDQGLVPIEKITLDMRVWDGVKFVSHSGLVEKGIKDVWYYQGLVATLDHIVWTEEEGETTFQRAAASGSRLLQSGAGRTPIRTCGRDFGRAPLRRDGLERALRALPLRELRARGLDIPWFVASGEIKRVRELHETPSDTEMARSSAHRSEGPLHEPERHELAELWRSGDRVSVRGRYRGWTVDHGEPRLGGSVDDDRQDRRERSLRGREPAVGDAYRAELEQTHECARAVDVCTGGMALRVQHGCAETDRGMDARTDHRASQAGELRRATGTQPGSTQGPSPQAFGCIAQGMGDAACLVL